MKQKQLKRQIISKWLMLVRLIKKHQIIALIIFAALMFLFLISGSSNEQAQNHKLVQKPIPFEQDADSMAGVKESVDPRDVWTSNVTQKVDKTFKDLNLKIKTIESVNTNKADELQAQIRELKDLLLQQKSQQEQKEFEESLRLSNQTSSTVISTQKRQKTSLGSFNKEYSNKKRNIKEYLPAGTIAKAVIVQGVVVGTGSNTQSNPEPIILRLTDVGIFSKGKHTDQIKEAMIIGDCSGDLSSERAKCRLQTLSLENDKGELIERPVRGWIAGEDGRNGIKGFVVDKSSDMLRMAMLNGVLGGMSSFLQNQSTKSVFPISPISGQKNAMGSMDQLKGGAASGAGNAFSKMADFVMDRFDSMSPQIVVTSNRQVAIVFQEGVNLHGEESKKSNSNSEGNLNSQNYNTPPISGDNQAQSFQKTLQTLNNNNGSDSTRAVF